MSLFSFLLQPRVQLQINFSRSCNIIRGSFDSFLIPHSISKSDKPRFFRKAFCRVFQASFAEEQNLFGGLKALRFEMSLDTVRDDLDNPETNCYCKDKKCYKSGLGNIAPCSHSKKELSSFESRII